MIGFGGVPERRTQLGSEVLEHLQGLRDYLALAEADRLRVLQSPEGAQRTRIDPNDDDAVIKLYEKLLPWAMVWGVEKQWQGVLGQQYAETQTEPSNMQFASGFAGLSGFATSAASSGFAQTVTQLVLELGRRQQLLRRLERRRVLRRRRRRRRRRRPLMVGDVGRAHRGERRSTSCS